MMFRLLGASRTLARRVPMAALMPAAASVGKARTFGAMALTRRVPAPVMCPSVQHQRGLCGVTVDMTCRVYSCKVADDAMAHQLDLLMDDFLEHIENHETFAEGPGTFGGASRLVCKSEWDYKFIVKFSDIDTLKLFMAHVQPELKEDFLPRIEALIGGKVHEQNFVYDDI
ncbi:hypothetical protein T492DRAFT_1058169, partial [Pavlovales sp. CCMP2436]